MCNLIFVNHLGLLHLLNGHNFRSLLVPADSNLSKGTSSNDLERFKIPNSNFGSPINILLAQPANLTIVWRVLLPCAESLAWSSLSQLEIDSSCPSALTVCPMLHSHYMIKGTTFLLFLLFILKLGVLAFNVGFGYFSLLSGYVSRLKHLLSLAIGQS